MDRVCQLPTASSFSSVFRTVVFLVLVAVPVTLMGQIEPEEFNWIDYGQGARWEEPKFDISGPIVVRVRGGNTFIFPIAETIPFVIVVERNKSSTVLTRNSIRGQNMSIFTQCVFRGGGVPETRFVHEYQNKTGPDDKGPVFCERLEFSTSEMKANETGQFDLGNGRAFAVSYDETNQKTLIRQLKVEKLGESLSGVNSIQFSDDEIVRKIDDWWKGVDSRK